MCAPTQALGKTEARLERLLVSPYQCAKPLQQQKRGTMVVCYGLEQPPFPAVAYVHTCTDNGCSATHAYSFW